MVTIHTRGKNIDVPSTVGELSPENYIRYCEIAIALASGTVSEQRARELLLSHLLGMWGFTYHLLKPEHIAELSSQLWALDGFFVVNAQGVRELDFNCPCNLLPEFEGYTGPADWLDGFPFGKFVDCLNLLVSPNLEACEHVARLMYSIADSEPVPFLLAFHCPRLLSAVWNAIMSGPVEINGKAVDFGIIFRPTGRRRPDDNTGWSGVVFEVATAGVFGSVPEVEATDLWAVLLYLYKCKFEYIHEQSNNSAN